MKQFHVTSEFFDIFPKAHIYTLHLKHFEQPSHEAFKQEMADLLEEASLKAHQHVPLDPLSKNAAVAVWRDAYKQFKSKKGARASIEALLKRIKKGHIFTPILPIVDIYNSISLEYGVPVGVADIDQLVGDVSLGVAKGGESFRPLGETKDDPALPGEVCYYDDAGAICRNFIWREAQRTMMTEDSHCAILIIEAVYPSQYAVSEAAQKALAERLEKYLNVIPELHVLTKDCPSIPIP
ncbi:B3/B4 domain-containing protein [Allofustis seminis]|uniref:B3/B4 domain-containing protein n=1 Tax=Allofustis seminis TaxID=166939 RepID=UPI000371D4BF|nr:phenylalanine--tRNA ligase beta subunit-related protein [Allofustis seminis]